MTKRVSVCLLLIGLQVFLLHQSLTAVDKPNEYQVKAAFIYQFTKFVEWPSGAFADSNSPLIIGVLGDDPFRSSLDDAVRGKDVGGRRLVVKRYSKLSDLQYCHVLFVSASEEKRLSSVISKIKAHSTLSVSDISRFSRQGGIIELTTSKGKIEFEINTESAKQSNLKVSSRLLKLASAVRE